jgi:hypothetical protein
MPWSCSVELSIGTASGTVILSGLQQLACAASRALGFCCNRRKNFVQYRPKCRLDRSNLTAYWNADARAWPAVSLRLKIYNSRMSWVRRVAPYSGMLARRLRFPNPLGVPWRQPVVEVGRKAGIGDVLMCTPALRELKRRRPASRIRFYTDLPSIVRGLPYIDEVLPTAGAPPYISLEYESAVPSRLHLAQMIGESLGLSVRDMRPDCAIDYDLVERFHAEWRTLPRPHIVVSRHASRWTPNKEWPDGRWTELIHRPAQAATVIEIGTDSDVGADSLAGIMSTCAAVLRLTNSWPSSPLPTCMSVRRLVRSTSPPLPGNVPWSSLAATRARPTPPTHRTYPCTRPWRALPCWLREPCPYDLKCLKAISPARVEEAIWSLWREVRMSGGPARLSRSQLPRWKQTKSRPVFVTNSGPRRLSPGAFGFRTSHQRCPQGRPHHVCGKNRDPLQDNDIVVYSFHSFRSANVG